MLLRSSILGLAILTWGASATYRNNKNNIQKATYLPSKAANCEKAATLRSSKFCKGCTSKATIGAADAVTVQVGGCGPSGFQEMTVVADFTAEGASFHVPVNFADGALTPGTGTDSIQIGRLATASGDYSVAVGFNTTAADVSSIALGNRARATGYASMGLGFFAKATGDYGLAAGVSADASGDVSTAIGNLATASGYGSMALGYTADASGVAGAAVGLNGE